MKQIIIGLLGAVDDERTTSVLRDYTVSVEKSGGTPILLPYTDDEETRESFISLCDGFLFAGGADIEPKYYGEERLPTCERTFEYRDEYDLAMLGRTLETGKPILAICRGMQLVNIFFGGKLYQDIPTERPSEIAHRQTESKYEPSHSVRLIENAPLCELIGKRTMHANSFHHQGVRVLGEGLRVMAEAEDGTAEAVYLEGERYLHAFQWHPERLYPSDADNQNIFKNFVNTCKIKKNNI